MSDVMRAQHRKLTPDESDQIAEVKRLGEDFIALCNTIDGGREIALAKTKIEEAVMWAVKGITA